MISDKTDFTVMTMNLRFGLADDGDNSWDNRKDLFVKLLERYPSTFLGIQESNHFQTEFLISTLNTHHSIGWHNLSAQRWQSNLIFYHKTWQCLERRHFFLSNTPDVESKLPKSKWPRQCVIGLFQQGDFKLIAVNTHFDFEPLVQKRSAELILGFLSDFPKEYPVIITGDFNTSPGSIAYNFFMNSGFSEVFENEYTSTFHGFKGEDESGKHIDWILHRGGLHMKCNRVIRDSFSGRFPSDHYPVLAEFESSRIP